MKEEYVIDFDCDVYLGSVFGKSRKVAHIVGAAITDDNPEYGDELDPDNTIPDEVLKYLGLEDNESNYVITRLRCWGRWHGPARDSLIWIRSVWGSP